MKKLDAELAAALAAQGAGEDEGAPETTASAAPAPEGEDEGKETPAPPSEPEVKSEDHIGKLIDKITNLTTELSELKATSKQQQNKINELETCSSAAKEVVRTAVARLSVAVNSNVIGIDTMSLDSLCQHFNVLNKAFEEKYPAAARSRVNTAVDDKGNIRDEQELQRRLPKSKSTK